MVSPFTFVAIVVRNHDIAVEVCYVKVFASRPHAETYSCIMILRYSCYEQSAASFLVAIPCTPSYVLTAWSFVAIRLILPVLVRIPTTERTSWQSQFMS